MGKQDDESCRPNPNLPHGPFVGVTAPCEGLQQAPPSYAVTGQLMLIGLLISAALMLLLFILYTYLRHRHMRTRLRPLVGYSRRPHLVFSFRAEPSPNRLDQTVIDSIPVIELPLHGDDTMTESSCAVCISEFAHGEKVRVLPQCGHRFHLECIDMWFDSHSTCPLCRSDVNSPVAKSDAVAKLEEAENKEIDRSISVDCSPCYGSRVHQSPLDDMV